MACKPKPGVTSEDVAQDQSRCRCYGAVMQAYKCLIDDQPESIARDAALRIYRHHHPEDTAMDAKLTVERWTASASGNVH